MCYGSASEGEIVESDGETKATTTQPPSRDSAIDRKNRPRSPVSRSPRPPPQLDGAYDDDASLDYDGNGRAKRLDARPQHQAALPHGQKRRREERQFDRDRTDPRRFKVHYEDNPSSRGDAQRQYGESRDALSGARARYTQSSRGDRNRDHRGSPPRRETQSHSTGGHRPSSINKAYPRDEQAGRDQTRERNGYARRQDHTRSRRSSTQSSFDRESTPSSRRQEDQRTERRRSSLQDDASLTVPGPESAVSQRSVIHGSDTNVVADIRHSKTSEETLPQEARPPKAVDEATLIEERRKRREALRAKHKNQQSTLLQQALHVSAPSQPSTPQAEAVDAHDEASTVNASPRTPQQDSPGSPALFAFAGDDQLANPAQVQHATPNPDDGPSAADYDPSMDMEQTIEREQQAMNETETAAASYDETKDTDRAVVVPKVSVDHAKASKPKEFDMFADDDDDDMFAPEQSLEHKKDDGTQAVRIPEAKQLDRSMLDDWDDPEGYYRIILGELLDSRYHVQTNLGKGVFSAVVRAQDTELDKPVAIKIIRKQESMYRAGIKEIEILQKLVESDPEDKKHIIRLERHFEHKGHLCMVFESLSINLREVLKKFGRDVGINIKAVRSYAQQMFLGLSLLKKCEILHADLKPDNVLVNEARSTLKIADLGSAMDANDNEITDVLVSRFYRAPEIMLGIRHDYAIDMWSIGCTLFELYTGKICFTGPTNNQMLRGIMECRGKIPNRMLKKSEFWAQHFDPDGTFLSQEVDNVTRKEVIRRVNITRTIPAKELRARLFANAKGLSPADAKELNLFADLLDKCLSVDPARRITPNGALKHGFISRSIVPAKV